MKIFQKILVLLCLTSLLCRSAEAQTYSYGLDEKLDAVAEKAIRAKMDSIHNYRPTVALVLSGGGAKGAAHIGVFRYLEEHEIPVDVVLGTSMGGLMGGMYSVGLSATQIDSLIRTLDWGMVMSDKVPLEYLSYPEKMYKRKYLLSMPFYYSMNEYEKQRNLDSNFKNMVRQMDDIRLGAEERDETSLLKDNLLSSLPSGFVYGQNVNNLFSSLTVGYQDEIPFWKLPIPFICVATEMVTGRAKVWYSGKLNTALRSTMSIPGLFTPVKTDGMLLVDGGMRNNYPADIAERIGADIIIGVDLSEGYYSLDEIKNLSDLAMQGIDMFGRSSYEHNIDIPIVTLRPDITGYNMLSFSSEAIDSLISRGYASAVAMKDDLEAVKELVGKDKLSYQSSPAQNLMTGKVMVSGVEILGVDDDDSRFLQDRLKIKAGQELSGKDIEDAVATIYGTKAFDYVTYELLGTEEPYRLRFNCKKGPIHHLGVGGRMDTEEIISLLLNIGLNVHSVRGHAFELTGKININPQARLHYYYKTIKGPAINAAFLTRYVDKNRLWLGDNEMNLSYSNNRFETYLSNIKWINLDLNMGVRADAYRVGSMLSSSSIEDLDIDGSVNNIFLGAFLGGHADTFDDGYFPTRGFNIGVDYSWVFGGLKERIDGFHSVKFDFRTVANIGGRVSVLPSANLRFLFGDSIPAAYANVVGGCLAGRYLDQQLSFVGTSNAVVMQKYLATIGADLRVKLTKNNYVSAQLDFGDSASTFKGMAKTDSMFFGAGVEYSYNSIIGPVRADIGWSSLYNAMTAYVGVGFDF